MSEISAMNSDDKLANVGLQSEGIKTEVEVTVVKPEPHECVVCATRSLETCDIYSTRTTASGTLLHNFLTKFTNIEFSYSQNFSKYICKNCLDLINVLEQAEIEYVKLKETFEAIISKNPLFETHCVQPIRLDTVKNESLNQYNDVGADLRNDSEDEPLAMTKKKRNHKVDKRRKKVTSSVGKRKPRSKQIEEDDRWECQECGDMGTGGAIAEAAHQLSQHNPILRDIKKEDSNDGQYSNGFDDNMLKIELTNHDDDESSNYMPDDEPSLDEMPAKRKVTLVRRRRTDGKKKEKKALHRCDKCNAKYTSLVRLEQHMLKHDGSKPPYICEVCGAHYKHKRACDIHVAMHKGISDWKCEECNKLFPSKGALQRHNNIHTGKLNYQCDLCGKSFIHTSSFKMHKLSHSGVKPHSCDVCGLALMTRSHLKRHKRVHSGEKRHECTICGKRFSERYNLAAHSKSHEAGDPPAAPGPPPPGAPAALPAPPPPPRRRLFRCPFCPERFERRYMLERHTASTHGRALERPPPTPRNTMSKLLKAQAARQTEPEAKSADSPDSSRSTSSSTPVAASKLMAHLSGAAASGGSWSGAYAEFNLRSDYH